jgi:hypothetical protein
MSTWAAFAAKGAAAAATTAAGAGTAQAISPAALDGFAVGTLLTGMCFLVVVAPRTMRRSRLSARRSLWPAALRSSKSHPDYFAAPADTHSAAVAPELAAPAAPVLETPAPAALVLDAPELAAPVLTGPALDAYFRAAHVAEPVPAPAVATSTATTTATAQAAVTAKGALTAQASAADAPTPAAPLTDIPELPLAFADPALEVFSPNASHDYAGHAGADPYAPGVLDPVDYAPATPPAADSASSSASSPAFDPGSDDDIVLPGDDDAAPQSGRGYRSKHRLTEQDAADRRSDPKRKQPRHAAPPSRFGSRLSGRLAIFPLAPARS